MITINGQIVVNLIYTGVGIILVFALMAYHVSLGRRNVAGVSKRGYNLIYTPWCILGFPVFWSIMGFFLFGLEQAKVNTINYLVSIGITLILYYSIMMLVSHFFRESLYADTLVIMWFLPSVLYFKMINVHLMPFPVVIFYIPEFLLIIILVIWLLGFGIVFGRKLMEHHSFKEELFSNASEITEDSEEGKRIIRLWKGTISHFKNHNKDFSTESLHKIKIYESGIIQTPLSIGFTQAGSRIVLPKRYYSDEELTWIFRHELMHIINGDAGNKLFMAVCASLGWFLPFFAKSLSNLAEDMELACDEKVLIGENQETKRFYAELLLKTAGEDRGFTSCLSSKGASMRYRLKRVLKYNKPKPIRNILVVTLLSSILFLSFGVVNVSASKETVADKFTNYNWEDCHIVEAYFTERKEDGSIEHHMVDKDDVKTFLEKTFVYSLVSGVDNGTSMEESLSVNLETPDGVYWIDFCDNEVMIIKVCSSYPNDEGFTQQEYYYPYASGTDAWQTLMGSFPE